MSLATHIAVHQMTHYSILLLEFKNIQTDRTTVRHMYSCCVLYHVSLVIIDLFTLFIYCSLIYLVPARTFAKETIDVQQAAFQRWGVLANWNKVYRTFDPGYVTKQLLLFVDLYEKGYIYQVKESLIGLHLVTFKPRGNLKDMQSQNFVESLCTH